MVTQVSRSALANTEVTAGVYGGLQIPTITVDAQGRLTSSANLSSSTFYVTPSGNIGIGTSSPTGKFEVTGNIKFSGALTENVFAVTGTTPALSPANGTIQTWTLSGTSTPTAGTWNAGESMCLMIDDGTAQTISWTSATFGTGGVTWVGGAAPTLATTGNTVLELWKVQSRVYGALVGTA